MTVTTDPRGLAAMRAIKSIHAAQGSLFRAADYHPDSDQKVKTFLRKSAVAGMDAGGLPQYRNDIVATELAAYILEQSIPGKLLSVARQLEFGVPLTYITHLGATWRGEGKAVRVHHGEPQSHSITPYSLDGIAVISDEAIRTGGVGTEQAIRDELASAAVRSIDEQFCGAVPSIPGVTPAGVLSAAEHAAGIEFALQRLIDRGAALRTTFAVFPAIQALNLPVAIVQGLKNIGVGLLTSESVSAPFLIDASQLALQVDGLGVSVSREALIDMSDDSRQDSVKPTATAAASPVVSLFSTNSSAIKISLFCGWELLRPGAVIAFDADPAKNVY